MVDVELLRSSGKYGLFYPAFSFAEKSSNGVIQI